MFNNPCCSLYYIGCLNIETQAAVEAIVERLEKLDESDEEEEVIKKKEKENEDSTL